MTDMTTFLKKNSWLKREICDMIEYCEMNGLPSTRDTLIMALVSLNIDEDRQSSSRFSFQRCEESHGRDNVIMFP